MPQEMTGRRIPVPTDGHDLYHLLTEPGDYCGPVMGLSGSVPGIWFLLPIARDPDVPESARSLHHICSPPHQFFEEPDGTLSARESIGAGHGGYYWHGFLTNGRWELNKTKRLSE